MSSESLQEYRCSCGKLLFKGLLVIGAIEIKCKRCGVLVVAEHFVINSFAVLESDSAGTITMASGDSEVLGQGGAYLLGKRLHDVYPLLNDGAPEYLALSMSEKRPYKIQNNVFMVRDSPATVSSCIIARRERGALVGYRVYNWPTK